jgi:hypothetical protein
MVTPVEVFLLARDVLYPLRMTESAARSCVSRAYYGAFLSARRVSGVRDTTGAAHGKVADWFIASPVPGHLVVGNRLNRLRDTRNQADYDLQLRQQWPLVAYQTMGMAEKVLLALGEAIPVVQPAPVAQVPSQAPSQAAPTAQLLQQTGPTTQGVNAAPPAAKKT